MTRRDYRCEPPRRRLHASHYTHHPADVWHAVCVCGWRSETYQTRDEARHAFCQHAADVLNGGGW